MRTNYAAGVFLFVSITMSSALLAIPAALEASEVAQTFSVSFSEQGLQTEERYLGEAPYQNRPFQLLTLDGLEITRDPGVPCLPVKVIQIYVPRGKEIQQVVVESQRTSNLPGEYLIFPGQREIPLSSIEMPEPVMPNEKIYGSASPYPLSPVVLASTGTMAGRRVVSIKIFPVQYVPAERRLLFNREIGFRVDFADCASEPALPRETANVAGLRNEIVAKMVENPSDIEADFPAAGTLEGPTAVEYLIICHENHADEYAPLRDWKTRKGVPAAIKTWQEITASYPGRDNPEKLRNCIKDYYLNHGTMWVTLGGSAMKAITYLRGCYCDVYGTVDDFIPCDLYFADLDGTWNQDNDSYWGETTDGTDLYPDVYVGRLPGNTGLQCSTTVYKVLTYEGLYSLPTDYQLRMSFMAEWLDQDTDGSINKNMIDNESVPARFDPIQKLYESSGNENRTTVMNTLNSGKGIVNHDGHGNVTVLSVGPDAITSDDMMALTNAPRYTVFYTLACDPAALDGVMGSVGRSFLESPNGGGFFVGNSRYGWYWPGASGYGTGDLFDREFFKSIFLRGFVNLGAIHADAKVQRIPYSTYDDTDRWTQFSLNLLGDPETPLWLDTPKALAASYPAEIETGSHIFTVSVSSGGSSVGQARICLWKGNDVYLVTETMCDGTASFEVSPADTGTVLVTITKNGYLPHLGSAHVADGSSGVAAGDLLRGMDLAVTPNPATGSATMCFSLPASVIRAAAGASPRVSVGIYDASGRSVANLATSGTDQRTRVTWDGRTASGSRVPPGIYFVRVECGAISARTKLVILK